MWEDSEQKAYIFFKENYDINAKLFGGADSTVADIYSPKFDCYIEIKQLLPSARCGQFTESMIMDPLYQKIINGDLSENTAKEFVHLHCQKKQVKYFIIIKDDISFMSVEEFLATFNFSWQVYYKKSGTSPAPKKDWAKINNKVDSYIKNNKLFCKNELLSGTYFELDNNQYFISNSKNSFLEIRKCSKTKNKTYLVEVQ